MAIGILVAIILGSVCFCAAIIGTISYCMCCRNKGSSGDAKKASAAPTKDGMEMGDRGAGAGGMDTINPLHRADLPGGRRASTAKAVEGV